MRQLHIKSLPSKKERVWIDRTEILHHAIFQIFEDFITLEYSNKNFNLEPWDLDKQKTEWDLAYCVEDNAWKLKCKEILSFWSEMKKHSCCWSRAHSELEHKLEGNNYDPFECLKPKPDGDYKYVKEDSPEAKAYTDVIMEMGKLEEAYEEQINEYCRWIINKRQWMWT